LSIFGLIVYWHTGQALGPFSVDGIPDVRALLHLQGYLATLIVTTLFAAALLVERQEAARETEAWRNRHEAVIRASGSLLYEFDPAQGGVLWDGDHGGARHAARAHQHHPEVGRARAPRRPHAPQGPAPHARD